MRGKCANVRMCKCGGNVQMCKCANDLMFNNRVYKGDHLHICTFSHLHISQVAPKVWVAFAYYFRVSYFNPFAQ